MLANEHAHGRHHHTTLRPKITQVIRITSSAAKKSELIDPLQSLNENYHHPL